MGKNYSLNGFGADFGREIVVDQRKKTLIAFRNHLELAPTSNWSQIHANGEIRNGKKRYSKIRLVAQDYSKGTKNNSFYCYYNFEPTDIKNLHNIICLRPANYKRRFFKVISQKGESPFQEVVITCDPSLNNPWIIQVTNGTANNAKPIKGSEKTIRQMFTYDQFFDLITKVYTFVDLWEKTFAPILIQKGHAQSKPLIEEHKNDINNNNGTPTVISYATGS